VDVGPILLSPGDRFEVMHDALLRWLILSDEVASIFLPPLRIEPSPDYTAEKTFSTFFLVGDTTVYFDPSPSDSWLRVRLRMPPSRDRLRGESRGVRVLARRR
jgi:hypothetical protein